MLHPEIPPGGIRRADYFGEARARESARYLARFAESFGVSGMVVGDRVPFTGPALAVAEMARDAGRLHPFRRAAMDAHWREAADIEDPQVLARCARAAGLDPELALAALGDPGYRARVRVMGDEARRAGITGIPTFLVGRQRIVGCQPYEVLAAVAEAEGALRRE